MKTNLIFARVFVLLLVYTSGQRRPSSWDSTRFGQRDWGRDRFGLDRGQNDRGQNTFRSFRPDTAQQDQGQNNRGQDTFRTPRPDTTQQAQGQNNRGQNTFRSLRPDTTQPPSIVGHVPGRIGQNRGFDQRGQPGKDSPPPLPPVPYDQGQIGQRRETGTGSRESSEVPSPVDEAFEMRQSGRPHGRGQSEVMPSPQPPERQIPPKVEQKEVTTSQSPIQQEERRRPTSGSSGQVLPSSTPQSVVGQHPGQFGSSSEISSSIQPPVSQAPPTVRQKELLTPQRPSVDKDSRQQEVGRRTPLGSSGQVLPSPTPQSVMRQHPGQQFTGSTEISPSIQPPASQVPPTVRQKGLLTPQHPSIDNDSKKQEEGRRPMLGSSGQVLPKELPIPQHPSVDNDSKKQEEGRRTMLGSSGKVAPTTQSVVGQHSGQQLGSSSSLQPPVAQTSVKVGQRDKNKETEISPPPNSSINKSSRRQEKGTVTPPTQISNSGQVAHSPPSQSRTGQYPGQQLGRSDEREVLPSSQAPVSQIEGRKEQSNGRRSDESATKHHTNRQPGPRELSGRIEPQSQLERPEHKGSPKPSNTPVDQDQRRTGSRQPTMPASPKPSGHIGQTGVSEQRNTPKQLQPPINQGSNRSRQNEAVEKRGLSSTVGQNGNPAPQSLPIPPTSQNSNKMREGGRRTPQNRQVFGQNKVPSTQQRGGSQRNGERGVLRSNGRGGGVEVTSRPPRSITIQKGILR